MSVPYDPYMLTKLAGILHTLSCDKEHAQDMEDLIYRQQKPDLCYFYLEESLVSESRPTHKEWEATASELCDSYNVSPEEILRMLPTLLECRQKIMKIIQKVPNAEALCRLVLFSELSQD